MTDLFKTGIRPMIDGHIAKLSKEKRDYGDYWSASSAGYCMRLVIMRRLGVPPVPEIQEHAATMQRVFSAGHVFHEWVQELTRDAGISVAQETELQDEELMVRGHFDDLILLDDNLILYDYKTVHSDHFNYKRDKMSYYHRMQLGTYLYMLRTSNPVGSVSNVPRADYSTRDLTEARILNISKDDLRMAETQLFWDDHLKEEVLDYWNSLNRHWKEKKLPPCTCADHEGGFMAKRSKKGKVYNDYFYNNEPCSLEWYKICKEESNGK